MIQGIINLPGDKSISHRVLMMASISKGIVTKINNLSNSVDVLTTIKCLVACGTLIIENKDSVLVRGGKVHDPLKVLNCQNSGTTARLLIGLLAGQGINADFKLTSFSSPPKFNGTPPRSCFATKRPQCSI